MKVGLVLEGGAMRGMYTAGILDLFLEKNIEVDCIVGVSAGALFGVNYVSGQKGRVIRYNKRFNCDKNYIGLRPFLKEGNIVNTKYAYYDVPRKLDPFDDESYKKSNILFYAVATDVETATAEYIQIKSVFEQMDVLRASASLPFVSKPVQIGNKKYLDGGISDSIPFRWLLGKDYDKVIVILTRDFEYRKKAISKLLVKLVYGKNKKLSEKLLARHNLYNESVKILRDLEKNGRIFVIRPSKQINIKRMEKNQELLQEVYDLGLHDGNMYLSSLLDYIKK